MIWAFYYQENYVRRCYKNYRFGWRRDACLINMDRLRKYNI